MPETADEFLAHYGVVGMKWGKRTGGLKDRVKGAALDRNQRERAITNKVATGKYGTKEKIITGALFGVPGLVAMPLIRKNANKRLASLDAQKDRIESGKMNIMDKLDVAMNTSTMDLLVSRRAKYGQ